MLQAGGHQRGFEFPAAGNVLFFDARGNGFGVLDREVVVGFADDYSPRFIAGFEGDFPGIVAKGDAGAGVENRFINCVLGKIVGNFRKGRADIGALVVDRMASQAAHFRPGEYCRAMRRVALPS